MQGGRYRIKPLQQHAPNRKKVQPKHHASNNGAINAASSFAVIPFLHNKSFICIIVKCSTQTVIQPLLLLTYRNAGML